MYVYVEVVSSVGMNFDLNVGLMSSVGDKCPLNVE